MKDYFRYFKIPFIIIAVMLAVALGVTAFTGGFGKKEEPEEAVESANTERTTSERVFDYGEVLSDEEEESLREEIREAEKITESDIVIVTLNESLVEYAAQYEDKIGEVPMNECVMVYADNFYDEHKFGYNAPVGDGVLLLDNWYRESDGSVYSWMSTCGKVEDFYSSEMIDSLLQDSLDCVVEDPYQAYSDFISGFTADMTGTSSGGKLFSTSLILIVSAVIALIFLLVNLFSKKADKTVSEKTYVAGGNPTVKRKEDRFINKTVTKTKIESESSSGGGGGGSHTSSSGASHGGGGSSR